MEMYANQEMTKPIVQEDPLGCAVACVAFVLHISYQDSLKLFKNGQQRAKNKANFYCEEIVQVLRNAGLSYEYKWTKEKNGERMYKEGSIVFLKESQEYPYGHYLVRTKDGWMDPWINFPSDKRRAGFIRRLPGIPTYEICSI